MTEKQLKRLEIYKLDGLDTIERLEEALENNKKCSETIDVLQEENVQLKSEIQQLKIDYSQFEELKQEYISRKELTYSEKLIIEDFYDWLINNHF